jgi:CheY-like chemotaxis protein
MKNVLIADDEKPFLLSLKDGLKEHADSFTVTTAENGTEAVSILQKESIDLLVTDLKMPTMDGFELLAHLSRHHPAVPVIVMTAFGTQEIEERLNRFDNFHYIEKPLDIEHLANAIYKALGDASRSFIRGINLATFLQLIQMEGKTCTLKITSAQGSGLLHIKKGQLYAAETKTAKGEKAAHEIVFWENPEIEMEPVCRPKEREINTSIEFILLEAFRIEDERRETQKHDHSPELQEIPDAEVSQTQKESSVMDHSHQSAGTPLKQPGSGHLKLRDFIQKLPAVKAYALFDERDHLLESFDQEGSLDGLVPSLYLLPGQGIGAILGSPLGFLELNPDQGLRRILFRISKFQVAVTLANGARLDQFMARFVPAQKK